MKNKAIVMSLLLNTCIATNVQAHTLNNTNYFYFGSKFNTLQPNHIEKSDLSNLKNLYTNYWSHSLYGFLIGYQNNSYFGLEISYNDPLNNQENINDIIKKNKKTEVIHSNYRNSQQKVREKQDSEEEAEINKMYESENIGDQHVNISHSNSNHNSLFPIKHGQVIKKIYDRSEYINHTNNTNKYSKSNLKNNKINIIYPEKNLEITTKVSYPILNSIDVYSRFGCSINLNKNLLTVKNFKKNYLLQDNIFPIVSAGIQYKIHKNLYSRIEFEKKITYYSNTKSKNLNSINFHFIWNFQGIFSNSSHH
ncbi:hypothetical protein [Buchnera aphidicola]|uniref:hypothetical protein n=1 Tax=Buchnera aphidicola TaxID=9 RepID=UPI002238C34E|nr:hypothetical protein [Buchnera aphidicola]MCW5197727.1 hypothetical protein [Buchnera aphidicola (Chaitophorus viminalis)]